MLKIQWIYTVHRTWETACQDNGQKGSLQLETGMFLVVATALWNASLVDTPGPFPPNNQMVYKNSVVVFARSTLGYSRDVILGYLLALLLDLLSPSWFLWGLLLYYCGLGSGMSSYACAWHYVWSHPELWHSIRWAVYKSKEGRAGKQSHQCLNGWLAFESFACMWGIQVNPQHVDTSQLPLCICSIK